MEALHLSDAFNFQNNFSSAPSDVEDAKFLHICLHSSLLAGRRRSSIVDLVTAAAEGMKHNMVRRHTPAFDELETFLVLELHLAN